MYHVFVLLKMTYLIQYDESEGKALYDTARDKAQTSCECDNHATICFDTNQSPECLALLFENVVDCGNGYCNWLDGVFILNNMEGASRSWSYFGSDTEIIRFTFNNDPVPFLTLTAAKNQKNCFLYAATVGCIEGVRGNTTACIRASHEASGGTVTWAFVGDCWAWK